MINGIFRTPQSMIGEIMCSSYWCPRCGWHGRAHLQVMRGWHIYLLGEGDPNVAQEGKRRSLNLCVKKGGWKPFLEEEQRVAEIDRDIARHESGAEARTAFAHYYQEVSLRELEDARKSLADAKRTGNRRQAENAEKIITKLTQSGGGHVVF